MSIANVQLTGKNCSIRYKSFVYGVSAPLFKYM